MLAYLVQRYVRLGRRAETPKFSGIVHFKRNHTRYPKTVVLAYLVQGYVL